MNAPYTYRLATTADVPAICQLGAFRIHNQLLRANLDELGFSPEVLCELITTEKACWLAVHPQQGVVGFILIDRTDHRVSALFIEGAEHAAASRHSLQQLAREQLVRPAAPTATHA